MRGAVIKATRKESVELVHASGGRRCIGEGSLVLSPADASSVGCAFELRVEEEAPGALLWVRGRAGDTRVEVAAVAGGSGWAVSCRGLSGGESLELRYRVRETFWPAVVLAKAEAVATADATRVSAMIALHKSIRAAGGQVAALDALVTLPARDHAAPAALPASWSAPAAKWSLRHSQVLWRMQPGTLVPGTRTHLSAAVPVAGAGGAVVPATAPAPIRIKTSTSGVSLCKVSVTGTGGCRLLTTITADIVARF